jgi:hypothetical protein
MYLLAKNNKHKFQPPPSSPSASTVTPYCLISGRRCLFFSRLLIELGLTGQNNTYWTNSNKNYSRRSKKNCKKKPNNSN